MRLGECNTWINEILSWILKKVVTGYRLCIFRCVCGRNHSTLLARGYLYLRSWSEHKLFYTVGKVFLMPGEKCRTTVLLYLQNMEAAMRLALAITSMLSWNKVRNSTSSVSFMIEDRYSGQYSAGLLCSIFFLLHNLGPQYSTARAVDLDF